MAKGPHKQEVRTEVPGHKSNVGRKGRVFLLAVVSLAAGFVGGWLLHGFQSSQDTSLSEKRLIRGASQYRFINPFVLTAVYDSVTNRELYHFKYLIFERCSLAEKTGEAFHVAYYFRDFTNGFWFGSGEREALLKSREANLPLMIAAFMRAEKEPDYLDTKLVYKKEKVVSDTVTKARSEAMPVTYMINGSQYSVMDLVELMVIRSDEEAAKLLLANVGENYLEALNARLGKNPAPDGIVIPGELSLKSYSAFFRMLYNASLLSREYSELALDVISRADNVQGIREAVPSAIPVCQRYGEKKLTNASDQSPLLQLHNAGIVYFPGKTYFLSMVVQGKDKLKLQGLMRDIAKITYKEVDRQMKEIGYQ